MNHNYEDVFKIFGNYSERWAKHCLNVANLSYLIAERIDNCDKDFAFIYGLSHDIGKSQIRSQLEPRWHCIDGYLLLEKMGFNELKMVTLTHSFPDTSNLSLVPGYYSKYFDPDIPDYEKNDNEPWDVFIKEHLEGYQVNTYDKIVTLADLMSAGSRTVSIAERLDRVKAKYGTTRKEEQTKIAIMKLVFEIEKMMNSDLNEVCLKETE